MTDAATEAVEASEWAPFTRMQAAVARRMTAAKATVPEFSVGVDVDMDAAVEFRESVRESDGVTLNDLVLKAVASALRAHPKLNASVGDGGLHLHKRVNLGVAVAAGDRLLVPTIRDADGLSLAELGAAVRDVVARVRAGRIEQADLTDGTFTVSNLGMLGVTEFEAIINPPQVAILAVGAVRRIPVANGDDIVPGHVLRLTLISDHRAVYGADAARFLADVSASLGDPAALRGLQE